MAHKSLWYMQLPKNLIRNPHQRTSDLNHLEKKFSDHDPARPSWEREARIFSKQGTIRGRQHEHEMMMTHIGMGHISRNRPVDRSNLQ